MIGLGACSVARRDLADVVVAQVALRPGGDGPGLTEVVVPRQELHDLPLDILRRFVLHRMPQHRAQRREDLPVRTGLFVRLQRGADPVHLSFQVGEGTVLLGEGGRREHDVREPAGLGQEGVLAEQQLDLLQRFPNAGRGRQGRKRILSHQIQRLDAPLAAALQDLHQRRARIGRRQRAAPRGRELGAGVLVGIERLPRQELRRHPHVHRPLLIGLFRQRVHAATGPRELAGHPGKVHEVQDPRIAVDLPRHALGAQDHSLRRLGVEPDRLDHRLPRRPGPGREDLPRQAGHRGLQRAKGLRRGGRGGLVHQILLDRGLDQRLDEPPLAPRRDRQWV